MLLIYMLYTVVRYNIEALFSIRVVLHWPVPPRASKHLGYVCIHAANHCTTVRVYWPHYMSAVYNVDLFDLL